MEIIKIAFDQNSYNILIFQVAAFAAVLALWLGYAARRLAYFLHMAQQNSYRPERYLRWLKGRMHADFPLADVLAVVVLALSSIFRPAWTLYVAAVLAVVQFACWRRPSVKKPLVWTDRAKRLYMAAYLPVAALLGVLVSIALLGNTQWAALRLSVMLGAVLVEALPYVMWLAVAVRQPFEEARNQRFIQDAARIISEMPQLLRIGITGSYGKTSSKVVLGRVLSEAKHTLVTPDSYNTPLGITLTVRNQLKPIHQVFVAEMGARQKGDIQELCDIVHPQIGIVTAIGPQHLETFHDIETVAATKFELIDSLPPDGLAVLNFDDPIIRKKAQNLTVSVLAYGLESADAAYTARDIAFSPQGMSFTLATPQGTQPIHTRLLGKHNVYNILAAAAVAEHLGIALPVIARAVAQVPPVEHRLAAKNAGGFTIIDDAFNSNPAGAKAAVDVLSAMPGGRKMIITPGMVELGAEQFRLNREFAAYAASKLDFIIIVGHKQSEPLLAGLQDADLPHSQYFVAADLSEAAAFMRGWVRPGDYVLFENDLPDSYL